MPKNLTIKQKLLFNSTKQKSVGRINKHSQNLSKKNEKHLTQCSNFTTEKE